MAIHDWWEDHQTILGVLMAVLWIMSLEELQKLVNCDKSAAGEYEMAINAKWTKTVTNAESALEINVGTGRLEQVNSFVYLVCRVTKDADCASEVKSMLVIGWQF